MKNQTLILLRMVERNEQLDYGILKSTENTLYHNPNYYARFLYTALKREKSLWRIEE